MSDDYDYDSSDYSGGGYDGSDHDDRGHGSHGGGGHSADPGGYAGGAHEWPDENSPEPAGTVELAIEQGSNPLVVALSAAGGVVASSFLQAVGAKLGDNSAQILQDAAKRRRWWRRNATDAERRQAEAFLSAVQSIADARPGQEDAIRLEHRRNITVVFSPGLPVEAISQYRRLDLDYRHLAGRTLTWTVNHHHPKGAWATDDLRTLVRHPYAWDDVAGRWQTPRN
ncbi:hypothetical protein [Streptomyces sp.]|uniref:hypothetical protein n=1 Tax=Streptomyces sp. TaxID=1931 RepID=UPI002F41BFDA